ncbi:hypothetical protein D3C79_1026440 [compost metagenome]
MSDTFQRPALAGLGRFQFTIGTFQISGQQAIKPAHHNQAHVIGCIPVLAHIADLLQGHVSYRRAFGALEP